MNLYHLLLSIPPGDHPPTFYQLLGIANFESDEEVIANAHRRQHRYVRTHSLRFPEEAEKLLNELTEAKVCLCDPVRRLEYEKLVRKQLEGSVSSSSSGTEGGASRSAKLHEIESSINVDSFSGASWELASAEPGSTHPRGEADWTIGSGNDCQIRVRAPWVSRRHCRVRMAGEKAWLEDLDSTNGTFINGMPVRGEVRLRPTDTVTLGKKTRLPWPLPADCAGADLEVFSIGRSAECDYVIDDKSVSSLHAQLIIEGDTILLEDLASTNGTRVGRLTNRIERCEIEPHLSLFFGAKKVFAKTLIEAVRDRRR